MCEKQIDSRGSNSLDLSDAGLALMILDQEERNTEKLIQRLMRRMEEVKEQLKDAEDHQRNLEFKIKKLLLLVTQAEKEFIY